MNRPRGASQRKARVQREEDSYNQGSMISVALIEDNRLVREGIALLLHQTDDFKVVVSSSSGDPALLRAAKPEVVLLNVGLFENDSLRFAEAMKTDFPLAKVIMMDLLPLQEDIIDFVNAGVSGFIMKDATFEELVSTIHAVLLGHHVLPPVITSTLLSQIAKNAVSGGREEALEAVRMTPREKEVVQLIGEGRSNKEIAAEMSIATQTVKSHVRNVMEKLALHSRLQIAAFAHRAGA